MSKITLNGSSYTVTSSAKLEDLKAIERYRNKELNLFEEEDGLKFSVFAIGTAPCGRGGISKNGILFDAKNSDGFAELTGFIPAEMRDNREEWITDKYGSALLCLKKIEDGLGAAIESINADMAEVASSIVAVD